MRSNRNGFSVIERLVVVTSFLSAGEAVACYLMRRVANFLKISGIATRTVSSGVLHKPLCIRFLKFALEPVELGSHREDLGIGDAEEQLEHGLPLRVKV